MAWPQTPARAQAVAEPAVGLKTVAVAALSDYDELLSDINFLGELGGRPAAAQMLEGMLALFTQGRGLEGLDKTRPIGVVLQTDGLQFVPVACLPVPDLNPMLELAEGFGVEPVGLADGVFEIELPNQTFFVKQSGAWSYLGQTAESLASAPADPGAAMAGLVDEYDLAVRLFARNVPEMYRTMAVANLQQGMQDGMEQLEGESDQDFEYRQRLAEAQIEQIQEMINGLDELTVGWAIDSEAKQVYADMAMKALPGSLLARAGDSYRSLQTNFSGFHNPSSAITMLVTTQSPQELIDKQRDHVQMTVNMLRIQAKKGLAEAEGMPDSPEFRAAMEDALEEFLKAHEAMMLTGKADMGASIDLAGGYTIVAGAYVADSASVDAGLRKLAEAGRIAAEEQGGQFPSIDWDTDSHAGVSFHHMAVPLPPQAGRVREVVGDTLHLNFGIGAEAVYFALGENGAASLKQAIDDSAAQAGEIVKPAEIILSLKQLLEAALPLADGQAEDVMSMLVESLNEQPEGNDHLRITTEPAENGARSRLLIEEGVLRAVGAAAAAAAAAQQGGGGGF